MKNYISLTNTHAKILNNVIANQVYLIYNIFHTDACHLEEKYINNLPGQSQSCRCSSISSLQDFSSLDLLGYLCILPQLLLLSHIHNGEELDSYFTAQIPVVTTITSAVMLIEFESWRQPTGPGLEQGKCLRRKISGSLKNLVVKTDTSLKNQTK